MKVKNVYVRVENVGGIEKVVLLREKLFSKKTCIDSCPDTQSCEYKCIFTGKKYFLIPGYEIAPLSFFLNIDELRPFISKKSLRKVYTEKNDQFLRALGKK